MKRTLALAALCASFTAHAQMAVTFNWKRDHRCSPKSPTLVVTDIPDGAKTLIVRLIDNDASAWNHGGGSVSVEGKTSIEIPEGALNGGYNGPCPPNFSSFGHDYQFVVRAVSPEGKELATASQTKTFSSTKVP